MLKKFNLKQSLLIFVLTGLRNQPEKFLKGEIPQQVQELAQLLRTEAKVYTLYMGKEEGNKWKKYDKKSISIS